MQNFVGKTKCIVGYMKVANCLASFQKLDVLSKQGRICDFVQVYV